MAEPASTTVAAAGVSLVALMTALLGPRIGPLVGPYIVIVLCSAVGSQWALLALPSMTKSQASVLMLRLIGTAVVLTAVVAQVVSAYLNVAVTEAYGLVSFTIGALGHRWTDLIDATKNRLLAIIGRTGGQ